MARQYKLSIGEFKRRVLQGVARAVREGVGVLYSTTEDEFAELMCSAPESPIAHHDLAEARHQRSSGLRQQPLTQGYVEFMSAGLLTLSEKLLGLKDDNIESPQIRAKARQLEALTVRIRKVFGEVQQEHGEESPYLNALSRAQRSRADGPVSVTREMMEIPVTELVMNLMGSTRDVMEFVKRVTDALPNGSLTEEVILYTLERVSEDHDPPEVVEETRCAFQVVFGGLAGASRT